MSQNEQTTTVDVDFKSLEVRVEELIRACHFLKEENKSLKVRQESLVAEKAALVEKTELARTRIEAMISRLKSLEAWK
ncbi:MAG: TIGR02449 family protein [Chromatiales bacterium]